MDDAKLTHAALDLASAARKGSVEGISDGMIGIRRFIFPFATFFCANAKNSPKTSGTYWNKTKE